MALSDLVRLGVGVGLSLVLLAAAISDVRRRRIPNWTVLAVIGLFVVLTLADGGAHVVSSLEAAGVALVVTVALYSLKVVGAGDSKLFTVVSLFAGLGYLPLLAVATTLTGGLVALISLATRPTRALVMFNLRGKGDWGPGIPYGLAIAVGGAVVMWAPMVGWVRPLGAPPPVSAKQIAHEMFRPAAPR